MNPRASTARGDDSRTRLSTISTPVPAAAAPTAAAAAAATAPSSMSSYDSPAVMHIVSHTHTPSLASDSRRGSSSGAASGSEDSYTMPASVPIADSSSMTIPSSPPLADSQAWSDWYGEGNWHPSIAPSIPASLHDLIHNPDTFPTTPQLDFDDVLGPEVDPAAAVSTGSHAREQVSPAGTAPRSRHHDGGGGGEVDVNPDIQEGKDVLVGPNASIGAGMARTGSYNDDDPHPGSSLSIVASSPSLSTDDSRSSLSSFGVNSIASGDVADIIKQFRTRGYLPGPKSRHEEERMRIVQRYDLESPKRRAAVDRICRIAKAYFNTHTIVITLVFEGHTVFAAEAGFDPDGDPSLETPVRKMPIDTSLCTHNLARIKDREVMIVPDLSKDWRFRNNPQSIASGGRLAFYAGAAIHLPTTSDSPDAPRTIPVGSICVLSDKPRAANDFSEDDQQVLKDLSSLVAEQFTLGYEQLRRDRERQQTEFLGTFLETTLVQPLNSSERLRAADASSSAPVTVASLPSAAAQTLGRSFQMAAHEMRGLTGATCTAIVDLRTFRLPHPQQMVDVSDLDDDAVDALGSICMFASDGDVDWDELVANQHLEVARAAIKTVRVWRQDGPTNFIGAEQSPFAPLLPKNVTATTIVPVAELDGIVAFMLIFTSSSPHFVFEKADRKFACNVGSVLASALLRERALLADRAKLAFVSQVSHELRTPLFAVASQLELLREFSTPQELKKISPMLDVADVCLESLRDVLDDTLDVAKFSNSTSEMTAHQRSALARTDLARLAAEVSQACFIRKRRSDYVTKDQILVQNDPTQRRPDIASTTVELILEVEEREAGWEAMIDVGGLKRVLLNLLGNSLKFTEEGYVKISLREVSSPPVRANDDDSKSVVVIKVEDTGCGMSEEFVRSGSIFTPFVQENPFRSGAGLGMSICETIIKRMGGKIDVVSALGQGTSIRITLPVDFASTTTNPGSPTTPRSKLNFAETPLASRFITNPFAPRSRPASSRTSPTITSGSARFDVEPLTLHSDATSGHDSDSTKPMRRRVISEELLALFNPGSQLAATPFEERPEYDFSAAVSAAQQALSQTALKRIPSMKRKTTTSSVTADKSTSIDLVDEVAKLSIAAQTPPPKEESKSSLFFNDTRLNAPSVTDDDGQRRRTESAAATTSLDQTVPAMQGPKLKVLYADDNVIARNILSKLLSGKGVAHVAAVDGLDAVQKFETEGPFHLVLLDVQMPNKDGIEAAFDIRRIEKEQALAPSRIIALSGLSNEADMRKAGCLDNVAGPVDHWIVKGNRSLRQVMTEVMAQKEVIEEGAVPSPTISDPSSSRSPS
ncbi:hypothetical protein MVLG_02874 [Microbotryum lychnidis-dioicae p1A1 Lamole]|uniref:histidine kinase n=1 Tax=Microbotryum lychnidis-dioicae (strain p1A1 Lamole / MvSl-1064) TaxID=683840 RepID=U5H6H4_USTV1|nr:hypothetical protein MVLG_02874 [Microbotryum lychnidis-dioicae p1A1 Lamole]|eukprot:KDE06838.1 hypothetical protein MVLG_02874 [Microbotryum lychnidis-dioicae p1A1 Lamole]